MNKRALSKIEEVMGKSWYDDKSQEARREYHRENKALVGLHMKYIEVELIRGGVLNEKQ